MTIDEFVSEFEAFSGLDVPEEAEVLETAEGTGPDRTLELTFVVPADDADATVAGTGFGAALEAPVLHPYEPWRVAALRDDAAPEDTRRGQERYTIDDGGTTRQRRRDAGVIELRDGTAQIVLIASSTA
ncbi:MAG: hypothetical protein ACK5OX_17990 [Desertimonas sp.]